VKWRLLIRPQAEADLREARNWYENQRPGLGDEFLADFAIAIQLFWRGIRNVVSNIIVVFAV
jgi:hypothetical protein